MEMPSQPDNTPLTTAPDGTQFPVVGIGASAGGVKALTTFFAHMPPDSNMAFVIVMHFPPEVESNLATIVQRHTAMPVLRITEQVPLRPNQIYVISPQAQLVLADGTLSLAAVEATNGAHMPIDQCLRALARAYAGRSAAIILSGTGSDGANGIKRVKEAGGVTLVQDPQDAEFSGMPRMALSTGLVDFVQPATTLPDMLITYWQRESVIETPTPEADADVLREIFAIVRLRTGHDFTHYKRPTVRRRLTRRLQVTGTTDLPAYLALLRSHAHEVQALLQNLLISVTNFFRDRNAWITLQTFIPELFANKGPEDQVRVWVTACATGEEAYTLAMLLREFADTLERPPAIQVFATDIDDYAIAIARQGVYPDSIAGDVSPRRLARFFIADQGGYRVKQELRDQVIFARHNVLHDPPFSQIDLITCRNLLIYLNREAQEQVIQTFHFALQPQGFLLLGSAESLDGTAQLFTIIDKGHRVFQRRPRPTTPAAIASSSTPRLATLPAIPERAQPVASFGDLHQQLISPYIPPSVIVSENGDIVHLGRGVSPFLHFGEGEPSHNLLKAVQPALLHDLRRALFMARQHDQAADVRRAQVEIDGETRLVNVIVEPIAEPQWARGYLLVMFQDVGTAHTTTRERTSDAETLITQLEAELERTTGQLRMVTEQYETVVAEYKAANEELHAINQELRAASEELETSKEEVQSVNEELTTVNQELKIKVDQVSRAHNDLQNLMTSTQIATLFLDRDLRIKRFTPSARQIFNLIPADLGRPLDHVTHTLLYDRLMPDATQVLQTCTTISREIETRDETWYLMHVNPYRTIDNHVDGVVLTFVDITERKRTEAALRTSEARFRLFVTAVSEIVYRMSPDWSEMHALEGKNFLADTSNPSLTWLAGYIPDSDKESVQAAIAEAVQTKTMFELEHRVIRADGSIGWVFSRAIPFLDERGDIIEWFGAVSNITERKHQEERQQFLLKLSDALRPATDPLEIQHAATHILGEQLGVNRAFYTKVEDDNWIIAATFEQDIPPLSPGLYSATTFGPWIMETYRRGERIVFRDTRSDLGFTTSERTAHAAIQILGAVGVPLVKGDKLVAILAVHTAQPRDWTANEVALVEETAERTWAAVERSRAEAALREAEAKYRLQLEQDVQERTAALNASNQLLQATMDSSMDMIQVFAAVRDEHETIIDFTWLLNNHTSEQIYGEVIGKSLLAHNPGVVEAGIFDTFKQVVETGISDQSERHYVHEQFNGWFLQSTVKLNDGVATTTANITSLKQAEQELLRVQAELAQRTTDKYQALFNSIDEGFALIEILFDAAEEPIDYRFLEVNHMFEQQTGLADVVGKTALEVVRDLDHSIIQQYGSVAQTGEPLRFEQQVDAMGHLWFSIYASRVGGAHSRQVAVVFDNITERKRDEERQAFLLTLSDALRAEPNADAVAHRALRMLVAQMSLDRCYIGVYRLEEDRAALTHQVGNDRVPPLPDAILLSDFPEAFRVVFDRTLVIDDFAETAGLSDVDRRNIGTLGLRALLAASLRKGENTPLWTIVAVSASPRRWTQGEITLVEDVTERTWAAMERARAETALRQSEERFRALLAKGADMITISARDGTILYASTSTERVSGYSAEEFQGSNPFADAIHPDDVALCREAMERLSTTPGLSLTLQHRARHKSGGWHWYEGTFTSLFHEPAIGGLVANVRDITERKQAETALAQAYNAEHAARAGAEEALKTREQFLSIASHELRTPLTSLIGFVYMLPTLTNQGPEALSAMTARIMRQAQRLNALIDQMLDVSRLQRGQFVVERQPVDIGAIVAQVVEEFRATQPPNSKHPIELHLPKQPLMVAGDIPRLEQVLINLLTNAVKYSPAGGPVRVLVAATTTETVIEVIDQGIGIPPAAQTQLFKPFYRAGNVGSQTSGFGLGLHIVREIVERHGGRIEVDSIENGGSTFRVMLPRMAKP